jgi:hypothetical protein
MHMATCLGFNLLGDPSLQIWSEKPSDASTFYSISAPATVKAGQRFLVSVSLTSFISGGNYPPYGPRGGAKVCLSGSESGHTTWCATNLTGSSGTATLMAPTMPGTYNLTVVDHPYLIPYLAQIQVLPPAHDVAVTGIDVSQGIIGQGLTLQINATVGNLGDCAEAFNVTAYANQTVVQTKTVALVSRESMLLTFLWDTTGQELGNYVIKVEADTVLNETDTANNTLTADYTVSVVPEYPQAATLLLMILPLTVAFVAVKRRKTALLCQHSTRSRKTCNTTPERRNTDRNGRHLS